MKKLFKLFWFITIFLFLAGLFFIYAALPERVGMLVNSHGLPNEFIDKAYFFYGVLTIFVLTNALLYTLYKLLYATGRREATVAKMEFKQALGSWLLGFAAVLNIFFVLAQILFSMINSREKYDAMDFLPIVYTGPALILLMFGVLLYILFRRRV